MRSIRRFLILVLLVSIAGINLIAAWYGYSSSVRRTEELFDERLAALAGVLAGTPPAYYRAATGDAAIAFQIWNNGELEAASGNVPAQPVTRFAEGYSDISILGFEWRAYALNISGSNRWVFVAESADVRGSLADDIVLASVRPVIIGLPIYALLIWLIVGAGMRPLNELAAAMRNKRSDDLSPVTTLRPPTELTALVSSINDLLARLNASFTREQQFAADAAHELRTPISVLKLKLHNLLQATDSGNPEIRSLGEAVQRLERSVEQVLMLYKMSPEQFAANFEQVDLAGLARQTIGDLYPRIAAQGQEIELAAEQEAAVSGDTFALETLLTNLIENASRYGGAQGCIRVAVTPADHKVRLTVEDSGPGIPAEERERVFERFYRGQHDGAAEGTGIGLAIVQNIAAIHGAEITLAESGFATGLAVHVDFKVPDD